MARSAPDPQWQRAANGRFHRFLMLDPEEEGLEGASGVYALWHAGARPEWVYVGRSGNLARTLHTHGEDKEITGYDNRGGLFVTWALIRDEYQPGVVRFLTEEMRPVVANPDAPGPSIKPIPVQLPGAKA